MSALKKHIDDVIEALIDGFRHAGDGISTKVGHMRTHADDVVAKLKDLDIRLGHGLPDPHAPKTDVDLPTGLSPAEYQAWLKKSVHNPDALDAMLGRYSVPGTKSYVQAAQDWDPPAAYFDMGSDGWAQVQGLTGYDNDDMFKSFNIPFIDKCVADGKTIHFSHDPNDFPNTALADELEYLERVHHYRFDPQTMTASPRP